MTKTVISDLVESYTGDVNEVLETLPTNSVQLIATSPPYYGLRTYLPEGHPDKDKEIGREETPEEYVSRMVGVFGAAKRVLRDDGTLWLNIGDSFENKNLLGIPWRVSEALVADGWYRRAGAPWVKRNSMPEPATDRPGSSLEYLFQFAKSPRYFYDREAVKKPVAEATLKDKRIGTERKGDFEQAEKDFGGKDSRSRTKARNATGDKTGRNRRNGDWWFESVGMFLAEDGELLGFDVSQKSYKGSHYAVFPPNLIIPLVKSGTSEKGCCRVCGTPYCRVVEKERVATRPGTDTKVTGDSDVDGNRDPQRHVTHTQTVGWEPWCGCAVTDPIPCTVLDPFAGSGTVGEVCEQLGRRCILIDLDERNLELQKQRVEKVRVKK